MSLLIPYPTPRPDADRDDSHDDGDRWADDTPDADACACRACQDEIPVATAVVCRCPACTAWCADGLEFCGLACREDYHDV